MSDMPYGLATYETNGSPKCPDLSRAQTGRRLVRVDASTPENFVCHPIADSRKTPLQEERCLDRQLSMSCQKTAHDRERKLRTGNRSTHAGPPCGSLRTFFKTN